MHVAPPVPASPSEEQGAPARSRVPLIVLAVVAALSAVFGAVVIFSNSTAEKASAKEPVALVASGDHSVRIGSPNAATKVVVYEDFGSADSRAFEIASRDFLRIEAARGGVLVEYHPVMLSDTDSSVSALAAWGVVLEQGRPKQALALHDLLFDQQLSPEGTGQQDLTALAEKAGVKDGAVLDAVGAPDRSWATSTEQQALEAGVGATPSVRVDESRLTAPSPVALADKLQRLILDKAAS